MDDRGPGARVRTTAPTRAGREAMAMRGRRIVGGGSYKWVGAINLELTIVKCQQQGDVRTFVGAGVASSR